MPRHRSPVSARKMPPPSPRAACFLFLAASVLLSGCQGGLQPPSMFAFGPGAAPTDPALRRMAPPEGSTASPTLADLLARRSILPEGSAYARVAGAVLSAAPGVEAAELGLARLRAEAAARNRWPSITPGLTLDSLAGLAAQIAIDQPLLDHGRRKAERDRALAEVDAAAVTLSIRQNGRVFEGLSLYLTAEQARLQGRIAEAATARLTDLRQIVQARVEGGLSDRSEEQVIAQTLAEMQATVDADRQTRTQALADLAALAKAQPPDALGGLAPLPPAPDRPALSVLAAGAAGARSLAEARIARAAALPGLGAGATLRDDGRITPGITLGGVRIGPGSPATVAAADAMPDLAARQMDEARATADRRRTELLGRVTTLRARQQQGEAVLRQTKSNLDLYVDQYRMGRRSLTDLTVQTATTARMERDQAALMFEIARAELELARDAGALVDGDRL